MVYRISQQDMDSAIASGRRGQFFAQYGVDDFIGYTNTDGSQIIFRGSLADVLEMFVPFNGIVNDVTRDMIRSPGSEEPKAEKPKKKRRKR